MSLLVAGSLHLDVVLRAPHLPALDETVTGNAVDYVFGGKGGNQAVAAARMGADVHFVGRTGSDEFGEMLRRTLKASGADMSQLQRDTGHSGMSAAIVNADGDYGAVIVSASNLNIVADAVFIPDGVSLILLQNEIPEPVNLAIAKKAKAVGAQVWLNAAPARSLSDDLCELVDLLIVNKVEAEFYAGATACCEILTTLGSEGVLFKGQQFDAHQVDTLSTHGAGDMFVGALAAQVARRIDLADAIPFAQAAAALHVSADLYARGTLDRGAVTAFLEDQPSR